MTLLTELSHLLPSQLIMATDKESALPYLIDSKGKKGYADAIVFPREIKQLQALLTFARTKNVVLVAQGGNTGRVMAAQALSPTLPVANRAMAQRPMLVVNFKYFNKISEVDVINQSLMVEAGAILAEVDAVAEKHDLTLPLKLGAASQCQIGGNIATNAGGYNAGRYGNMRRLVLGLEVMLPNGEILSQLSGLKKDNSGYDWKQWFIGSEGTLGFILKANLQLYVRPRNRLLILMAGQDLAEMVEIYRSLQLSLGPMATAAEIIAKIPLDIVRSYYADLPVIKLLNNDYYRDKNWLMMLELENYFQDKQDLTGSEILLQELADWAKIAKPEWQAKLEHMIVASKAVEVANLWQLREKIVWLPRDFGLSLKHDISLPLSQLPQAVKKLEQAMLDYSIKIDCADTPILPYVFGHMGDGNLHYDLLKPKKLSDQKFAEHAETINGIIYDIVMELGGSFAAEHGVGREKVIWYEKYKSTAEINFMHSVKKLLDPDNIMNAGVIFGDKLS